MGAAIWYDYVSTEKHKTSKNLGILQTLILEIYGG